MLTHIPTTFCGCKGGDHRVQLWWESMTPNDWTRSRLVIKFETFPSDLDLTQCFILTTNSKFYMPWCSGITLRHLSLTYFSVNHILSKPNFGLFLNISLFFLFLQTSTTLFYNGEKRKRHQLLWHLSKTESSGPSREEEMFFQKPPIKTSKTSV